MALYVIGCSILGIALACGRKAMSKGAGATTGESKEEKVAQMPSIKDLDISQ